MNIRIPRSELGVMALDRLHVITKPLANLKDRLTRAGKNRGKAVTHDVGGDPLEALLVHVFGKWPSEIVTITPATVTNFGMKRKVRRIFALQVAIQELREWSSEWNTAFLSILWSESLGLADMEHVVSEPIYTSFYDLATSQTGIKPAKENEPKIVIGRVRNQIVLLILGAKGQPAFLFVSGQSNLLNGVVDSGTLLLDAPVKETAEGPNVALSSGFDDSGLQRFVKTSDVIGVYTAGCERGGKRVGKFFQGDDFGISRLFRVLVHLELVGHKAFNLVRQILLWNYQWIVRDLRSLTDRIAKVAGLKIDPLANTADLPGKPVRTSFQVKILHSLGVHTKAFTDDISETSQFGGNLPNGWCAVQDLNLRPLPCQGSESHSCVHRIAFTNVYFRSACLYKLALIASLLFVAYAVLAIGGAL